MLAPVGALVMDKVGKVMQVDPVQPVPAERQLLRSG